MAKVLKCTGVKKCIGCGLCVLAASKRNSGSFSLTRSPIRVERCAGNKSLFEVHIDDAVKEDLGFVVEACPRGCFTEVIGGEDFD